MKSFVIYIVEFFLCSGLFMLLYRLLIVRKPNYGLCRKYLIVTMLLSAIIPALNVPLYPGQTFIQTVSAPAINAEPVERQDVAEVATASETVEEKVIAKAESLTPQLTLNEKIVYAGIAIYLLVALILLILIVRGILLVSKLKRQANVTLKPEYHLAVSDKVETPFSFWHTIFIRTDHDETERRQIISHEASHVAHRHSIEKLLMTVLRSVFWFNPFVWKAEQRLEEVQEWQADRDALSNGYNVESYRLTIIKQLFGCNPELTLAATNSLTKTRFIKMKQKDFQGSKFLQTAAAGALTLALFLSLGCGQSTKALTTNDNERYEHEENVIFTVDKFFDNIDGSSVRFENEVLSRSEFGNRIENGIEVYENRNNAEGRPVVTIAVNGIKTAESPAARELSWINEKTRIYIDGKRVTLKNFKSLKPNSYNEIFYYREPSSLKVDESLAFVYVEKDLMANPVIDYNYTVVVDHLNNQDIPDLISPAGWGSPNNIFTYQTYGYNAAAPLAKFAIDGKLTDYNTWKTTNAVDIIIYRNKEAEKRFGEGIREVVEYTTTRSIFIQSVNNQLQMDSKAATYEDIAEAIAQKKVENQQKGLSTIVKFHPVTPENVYNELISKYIDTTDSDLTIVYNKWEF